MHQLLREGVHKAEVARRLGLSRQTIYNWLKQGIEKAKEIARESKLDPFKSYIENRLERFDVPASVLLEEIRRQGYDGGITILRDYVAAIKDRHVQRVVDRFETEPGRQAQVDWASCGTIVHQGRRRRLSLLVVVLGYSRVIWAQFVVSERRPVLLELLETAFRQIGGIPRELLFDNLKQVVASPRRQDRVAEIQPGFAAFSDHWGFAPIISPPYWPRAKGKVERAIQYIKTSFLEGRSFTDLDDLNAQLRCWLAEVANVRIHATTKERPVDRLAADLAAMLPIGDTTPFPAVTVAERLADHDARISYLGVRYSVDPEILTGRRRGEKVEVHHGTDERIRIFSHGLLVGEHKVLPSGSPPQDAPLHAAKRRTLRQLPTWRRDKGSAPRFDQKQSDLDDLAVMAPQVAERPLSAYEAA